MNISAVVLTKNEEKNIKECIQSLKWCDEVVVIDDHSQDKTVEIAKKMGAKVFVRPLNNDFGRQRNFGLEKAKGDWVLFVDADERATEALAAEIKSRIINEIGPAPVAWVNRSKRRPSPRTHFKTNHTCHAEFISASGEILKQVQDDGLEIGSGGSDLNYRGFYIKRRDFIFGKWLKYGETGKIKLLRLAKKDAGRWERSVHEVWQIKGETGQLKSSLLHYPHPSVADFLEKINQYSSLRASELYHQEKKVGFLEMVLFPSAKFLKNFFWQLGFLDGLPGFLHAIFMSLHSFLVRGKLWLLWKNFDKKNEAL